MRTFGFALLASLSVACSSSSPVTPTSARATAVTPDSMDAVIVELADKGGKTLVAYLVSPDTGDQTGTLKMSVNAGQTEVVLLAAVHGDTLRSPPRSSSTAGTQA